MIDMILKKKFHWEILAPKINEREYFDRSNEVVGTKKAFTRLMGLLLYKQSSAEYKHHLTKSKIIVNFGMTSRYSC